MWAPWAGIDEQPLEVAPEEGTRPLRPLYELGLVAAGFGCYLVVRWSTLGRTDEAFANARDVLALEEGLGLDWEHTVQSTTYAVAPWLGHAATYFYVWAYFPVLVAVALWLYRRRPDAYRTLRTALVASGLVGLAVAWLTVTAVVAFRVIPRAVARALCVAFPAAMLFAVVATGNHWMLDIPAGLALAAVGLVAATHGPAARHHDRGPGGG